jgi:hypothetical protein
MIWRRHFAGTDFGVWVEALVGDLVRAGAAARVGPMVCNSG